MRLNKGLLIYVRPAIAGLAIFFGVLTIIASAPLPATRFVWVKPDGTNQDYNRDNYACLQESQQRVSQSAREGRSAASSSTVQTNDQLYNACMQARGWSLQVEMTAEEKKAAAKRDDSSTVLPDRSEATKPIAPPVAETVKPINSTDNVPDIAISPNVIDRLTTAENPSPQYVVVIKAVNLRSEANDKSKILFVVKKGERVEKLGFSGNWLNVKLSTGKTGWIFKDYAKTAE